MHWILIWVVLWVTPDGVVLETSAAELLSPTACFWAVSRLESVDIFGVWIWADCVQQGLS